MSAGGQYIFVGYHEGMIKCYDCGKMRELLTTFRTHRSAVKDLFYLSATKTLYSAGDRTFKTWSMESYSFVTAFLHRKRTLCLGISSDGHYLAGGTEYGSLLLVSLTSAANSPLEDAISMSGDIVAVAFSPDSSRIAVVSSSGQIAVLCRLAEVVPEHLSYSLGAASFQHAMLLNTDPEICPRFLFWSADSLQLRVVAPAGKVQSYLVPNESEQPLTPIIPAAQSAFSPEEISALNAIGWEEEADKPIALKWLEPSTLLLLLPRGLALCQVATPTKECTGREREEKEDQDQEGRLHLQWIWARPSPHTLYHWSRWSRGQCEEERRLLASLQAPSGSEDSWRHLTTATILPASSSRGAYPSIRIASARLNGSLLAFEC